MTTFLILLAGLVGLIVVIGVASFVAIYGVAFTMLGYGILIGVVYAAFKYWPITLMILVVGVIALVAHDNSASVPNRTEYSSAHITELVRSGLEREGVFDPSAESINCPGTMEVGGSETCTLTSPKGGGTFRVELAGPESVNVSR